VRRKLLLVLEEEVGAAVGQACEENRDSDAVALARAAQIACQPMCLSSGLASWLTEN